MEHTQELVKALAELKRITGITMDVTADSPEEAEQALTQIRCLCTAYKEKYNKSDFLQGLMTGGIPAYDIAERAARLHINADERRILFLLEAKEIDETVMEILKSLFPAQTKTYLVPVTGHTVAVLRPVRSGESEKDSRRIARMIVDTLNTEALVQIRLSYSFMFDDPIANSSRFAFPTIGTRLFNNFSLIVALKGETKFSKIFEEAVVLEPFKFILSFKASGIPASSGNSSPFAIFSSAFFAVASAISFVRELNAPNLPSTSSILSNAAFVNSTAETSLFFKALLCSAADFFKSSFIFSP